jgi:hypothetical protein
MMIDAPKMYIKTVADAIELKRWIRDRGVKINKSTMFGQYFPPSEEPNISAIEQTNLDALIMQSLEMCAKNNCDLMQL